MTEIIVYRNPLEAMLWNNMMNGDGLSILLFVLLGGFIFITTHSVTNAILLKILKLGFDKSKTISMWLAGIVTIIYIWYGAFCLL